MGFLRSGHYTSGVSPPGQPLVIESLREASKSFHRRIDRLPALARLVAPDLDREGYIQSLRALYAAHRPVETAIDAYLDDHPGLFDFSQRRKADLLLVDLADLQAPPPALPRGVPASIACPSALAGTLYVVEGSTLGARVISRHVLKTLGLDAGYGARFFNAYGDAVHSRWETFQAFAERQPDPLAASQAAKAIFTWFLEAMETAP